MEATGSNTSWPNVLFTHDCLRLEIIIALYGIMSDASMSDAHHVGHDGQHLGIEVHSWDSFGKEIGMPFRDSQGPAPKPFVPVFAASLTTV